MRCHLNVKTNILPRQARDKHREKHSKKRLPLSYLVVGAAFLLHVLLVPQEVFKVCLAGVHPACDTPPPPLFQHFHCVNPEPVLAKRSVLAYLIIRRKWRLQNGRFPRTVVGIALLVQDAIDGAEKSLCFKSKNAPHTPLLVSFLFVRSFVLSLSWQIVEFHEEGIGWVLLSPAAAGRPSFGPAKNPFCVRFSHLCPKPVLANHLVF